MRHDRCVATAACLAVSLVALGSSPVVAQDRDTLWTKATAEGRVISLAWDKQHPWDAELTAGGAELVAKYRVDASRDVSESVARATVRPGDSRVFRFALPESLRANPVGPVCLSVQLPNRRVLPIRRANAQLTDTAGFRYDAWDRAVRQRTQAKTAEDTVAAAQRALTLSAQSIANQEASVASRGWTTLQACDAIAAPTGLASAKPFDAVAPPEQDEAARRVCVRQVWVANELITNYVREVLPSRLARVEAARDIAAARSSIQATFDFPFVGTGGSDVTTLLDAIAGRLGGDNPTVTARQGQLREFVRDWTRWAAVSKEYRPQFGTTDSTLGWPSTASEIAFRIFGPQLGRALKAGWAVENVPPPSTRDLESFLGASLDAYAGCVDDGRKQLATKWETWVREQATAPQFATSAKEFLVRECKQEVGLVDKLRAERVAFQTQLARAQAALTTATTVPALATRPEALNLASCSQP